MSVLIDAKKEEVIQMRRLGHTFSEISSKLNVPKGTISRWIRGVNFDDSEKQKISENQVQKKARAIAKSKVTLNVKKKFAEREAFIKAKKIFEKYHKDPLFTFGLGLYVADGQKGTNFFQYSADNKTTAGVMLVWVTNYLNAEKSKLKFRIFCQKNSQRLSVNYWITIIGSEKKAKITEYSTQNKKKTLQNKGFLQILCYEKSIQQQILFLKDMLIEKIK